MVFTKKNFLLRIHLHHVVCEVARSLIFAYNNETMSTRQLIKADAYLEKYTPAPAADKGRTHLSLVKNSISFFLPLS